MRLMPDFALAWRQAFVKFRMGRPSGWQKTQGMILLVLRSICLTSARCCSSTCRNQSVNGNSRPSRASFASPGSMRRQPRPLNCTFDHRRVSSSDRTRQPVM
jgi:hypothetical protein